MRAAAVRKLGEAPVITDLPVPGGQDSVLIRVSYAGVNPVDWQLVDQLTPGSSFPFVVGVDVAGVVEHVPARELDLHVGDRVFGMARSHGSYAEYTAVPASARTEPLARIPGNVPDDQAAALPVAGIAALGSLELLALAPGERLVVMGAAGAVGGYAVQMAVARGAYVIATAPGRRGSARHQRRGCCPGAARGPPGRRRRGPRHRQWPCRDQARRGAPQSRRQARLHRLRRRCGLVRRTADHGTQHRRPHHPLRRYAKPTPIATGTRRNRPPARRGDYHLAHPLNG
jgi:hypothetical protein